MLGKVLLAVIEKDLLCPGESGALQDKIVENEELLVEQLRFGVDSAAENAAVLPDLDVTPGPEAETVEEPRHLVFAHLWCRAELGVKEHRNAAERKVHSCREAQNPKTQVAKSVEMRGVSEASSTPPRYAL